MYMHYLYFIPTLAGIISENTGDLIYQHVCPLTLPYTMLVALSMCLRVGAGIVGGSCEVLMIAIFLAPRWVCR